MSNKELNTKRWEQLREYILRRDCYIDQLARRYGKRYEATTVHHIFPREYFPQWTFEPWNLISLSNKTHNSLHNREDHKLTKEGVDLLRRTARKYGIEVTNELLAAITTEKDIPPVFKIQN